MATTTSKRGNVTALHREEARHLLNIWNRMKPRLRSLGWGTQESFGFQFGIGNQSAVAHFLNGRAALSPKAAAGFARGLECKVSDFSPRLAALMNEQPTDAGANVQAFPGAQASTYMSAAALVRELARRLDAIPRAKRQATSEELALLARAPKDPDALQAVMTMLDRSRTLIGQEVYSHSAERLTDMERAVKMIEDSYPAITDPRVSAHVLARLNALLLAAVKSPEKVTDRSLRRSESDGQSATGPTRALRQPE